MVSVPGTAKSSMESVLPQCPCPRDPITTAPPTIPQSPNSPPPHLEPGQVSGGLTNHGAISGVLRDATYPNC
ncbi:hypothetical protein E2C01_039954 [Portunus trituberculatus]|uniref:Uncharacterized protein n=1 Tax=Portunus trituberculatus TaxID=210409 RepID=A0A5B7FF53_PORTR|nr:hypothetical protein [Portunus trituberculatus]